MLFFCSIDLLNNDEYNVPRENRAMRNLYPEDQTIKTDTGLETLVKLEEKYSGCLPKLFRPSLKYHTESTVVGKNI